MLKDKAVITVTTLKQKLQVQVNGKEGWCQYFVGLFATEGKL